MEYSNDDVFFCKKCYVIYNTENMYSSCIKYIENIEDIENYKSINCVKCAECGKSFDRGEKVVENIKFRIKLSKSMEGKKYLEKGDSKFNDYFNIFLSDIKKSFMKYSEEKIHAITSIPKSYLKFNTSVVGLEEDSTNKFIEDFWKEIKGKLPNTKEKDTLHTEKSNLEFIVIELAKVGCSYNLIVFTLNYIIQAGFIEDINTLSKKQIRLILKKNNCKIKQRYWLKNNTLIQEVNKSKNIIHFTFKITYKIQENLKVYRIRFYPYAYIELYEDLKISIPKNHHYELEDFVTYILDNLSIRYNLIDQIKIHLIIDKYALDTKIESFIYRNLSKNNSIKVFVNFITKFKSRYIYDKHRQALIDNVFYKNEKYIQAFLEAKIFNLSDKDILDKYSFKSQMYKKKRKIYSKYGRAGIYKVLRNEADIRRRRKMLANMEDYIKINTKSTPYDQEQIEKVDAEFANFVQMFPSLDKYIIPHLIRRSLKIQVRDQDILPDYDKVHKVSEKRYKNDDGYILDKDLWLYRHRTEKVYWFCSRCKKCTNIEYMVKTKCKTEDCTAKASDLTLVTVCKFYDKDFRKNRLEPLSYPQYPSIFSI